MFFIPTVVIEDKLKKPLRVLSLTITSLIVAIATFFVLLTIFGYKVGTDFSAKLCLPYHVYFVKFEKPENLIKGDLVHITIPKEIIGPKFGGTDLIKMVGAVEGDVIKIASTNIFINDKFVGNLDVADKAAKQLSKEVVDFNRVEIVKSGHVFLIGTLPNTYDSRYWGQVPVSLINGKAYGFF